MLYINSSEEVCLGAEEEAEFIVSSSVRRRRCDAWVLRGLREFSENRCEDEASEGLAPSSVQITK